TNKRATLAHNHEVELAVETNNRPAYLKARQSALDAGLILPEQAEALDRDFEMRTSYNSIVRAIHEEPLTAEEQLEDPDFLERYPHLGHENLERLRRFAFTEANRARGEMWDGLLNDALDGRILSKDELADMARIGM